MELFEKSQAKSEFFGSIMGRGIMMVALSLIKYRCNIVMHHDYDSYGDQDQDGYPLFLIKYGRASTMNLTNYQYYWV